MRQVSPGVDPCWPNCRRSPTGKAELEHRGIVKIEWVWGVRAGRGATWGNAARSGHAHTLSGVCGSLGAAGRLLFAPQVVQRLLLDVRQDVVEPAAGLQLAEAPVGIADPPRPQPPVGQEVVASARGSGSPSASCLRLFWHCASRAASRAACTAGSNSAIRMPMIVITTRSSTNVKPRLAR